ncbi:hypothetical protein [Cerasicoccus frondis]|uniref:hypothetical protein n=1 Tax=Cerasicoccus frondis TaxID=490090 RepID=UPI00285294E0|nr:hypothetical protein [Cerasicoccus frondis]
MKTRIVTTYLCLQSITFATAINDGLIRFDDPLTIPTDQGVEFIFNDVYYLDEIDEGNYVDDPSEMYFLSDQREIKWIWGHDYDDSTGDFIPQMVLTENGALELYTRGDPNTPAVVINGSASGAKKVLTTTSDDAFAIEYGGNAEASGLASVALGYYSEATGNYSFTHGNRVYATAPYARAYGYYSYAEGSHSTAIGSYTYARGDESLSIGGTANGDRSVSISGYTDYNAEYSLAIHTAVYGSHSLGIADTWELRDGDDLIYNIPSAAYGDYAVILGSGVKTNNDFAAALGDRSRAWGKHSFAFGSGSGYIIEEEGPGDSVGHEANGDYSLAFGEMNLVDGDHAHALGQNLTASSMHTTVIGRYNLNLQSDGVTTASNPDTWDNADPLFEIGNGDSTTPSNAVTVYKSGDVEMSENLHVAGTITLSAAAGDITMGVFGAQ